MLNNAFVPILGLAACSGTGKTTLLAQLLPLLKNAGLRVGMIKHAHHNFDIDQPGKDSYRLRKAGASQVLVASRQRWALMVETVHEASLDELLLHLEQDELDLILIEGFKQEAFPKIELHRTDLDHPWLFPDDETIMAVATDGELPPGVDIIRLDINNPEQVTDFILGYIAC